MQKSYLSAVVILLLMLGMAHAQTDSGQSTDQSQTTTPDTSQQSSPSTAFGQEPAQPQVTKFPPLSGLDEAALEPNIAPRNFLVTAFQAAEAVDSNGQNTLNRAGHRNAFIGTTRLNGMVGLQRLWSRYQVMMDYNGGGSLFFGTNQVDTQMHRVDLKSAVLWRTGALQFRDSVSYLPEGSFGGGSFGGVGGAGGLGGGVGAGGVGSGFTFFGSGTFGTLGTFPRLMNLSVLDIQQSLSPRSSVTLAGGYNLVHFTKSTGGFLLDSRQVTGQAGYNYTINRRNSIALAYGFQHFQFPTVGGGGFESHVINFIYGHQISGRMDLQLGAGPQLSRLSSPLLGSKNRISASGHASLRYRFPKTSMSLNYSRLDSAGSGFFAGAESDVVRFTLNRPFGRRWEGSSDIGFSHNKRLQIQTLGVNAKSYNDLYAGARLNRILTRTIRGFLFYQFNDLNFSSSFCGPGGICNHLATRNVIGLGLSWQPHPIRID